MTIEEQALKILRELVELRYKPMLPSSYESEMDALTNSARWLIHEVDGCKYVDDNGCKCGVKAVRESFGIACCKSRARERDLSFGVHQNES